MSRTSPNRLDVTQAGLGRWALDTCWPSLHRLLTRVGTLPTPPEREPLARYLRELHATIANDIRHKTYIPIAARDVPALAGQDQASDPFVRPVHQVIRQVLGRAQGGDSASAEIAAVNRRSRPVRNVLRALVRTHEPLMLLGDPGTGKTMTLQQAAMALAADQSSRVFPVVTLYVRLGEFFVGPNVGAEDVLAYVKAAAPSTVRPYVDALDGAGRLIVLFDGMDEMSRAYYNEHTQALSVFAGSRAGITKTLFSCRITDFSPQFIHERLVLLPFDRSQIEQYLRRYIPEFPVTINGERWGVRRLAAYIMSPDLSVDAQNPFVLWLLCSHLQRRRTFPRSRVELLQSHLEETFKRKAVTPADGNGGGTLDDIFHDWARFAFTITSLNRGAAVAVEHLSAALGEPAAGIAPAIRTGKLCGVLVESGQEHEHLVRFDHHRLQEYFTALHIHATGEQLSWLDKLDAPRWQETLLNLILMGGGSAAIGALADAIEPPAERPAVEAADAPPAAAVENAPAPADVPAADAVESGPAPVETPPTDAVAADAEEALLADRVELTSRILRQAGGSSPDARSLEPAFHRAVAWLAAHGNPITQVKMIGACRNVPQVDAVAVLDACLRSRVSWVRNQALILLASRPHGLAVGSDAATELLYDLANGILLPRLGAHLKTAAAVRQRVYWWSLSIGVLCALFNLVLLFGVAAALFVYAAPMLEARLGPAVGSMWAVGAYAGIVLAAAATAFSREPALIWAAILGSASITIGLSGLVAAAWGWHGKGDELFAAVIVVGIVGVLYIAAAALLAAGFQATALAVYLGATKTVRTRTSRSRGLFGTAWSSGGFATGLQPAITLAPVGGVSIGVGVLTFVVFSLGQWLGVSGEWLLAVGRVIQARFLALGAMAHLPIPDWASAIGVIALGLAAAIAVAAVPLRRHRKGMLAAAGYVALLAVAVPLFIGMVIGINFVFEASATWVWQLIGPYAGRLIVIVLATAVFVMLLLSLRMAWEELGRLLRRRRLLPPGSQDPELWKQRFERADAREQEIMLIVINHQAVSMTPPEFLGYMRELQPLVKPGEAESTYWSARAQLEQVLKHEHT